MPTKLIDVMVEQGATFNFALTVYNHDGTLKDLSGFSGRMQIRATVPSASTLVEATSANGMVTVDTVNSKVIVNIPASVTNNFTWEAGVYDIEIENLGGYVIRLAKGNCSLSPQVTR